MRPLHVWMGFVAEKGPALLFDRDEWYTQGGKSLGEGDSFFDSFTVTKDARNNSTVCVSQRHSTTTTAACLTVLVLPPRVTTQHYRLQMPWKMLLSLLPPSLFTIRLASGTSASASFSRFLPQQHKHFFTTKKKLRTAAIIDEHMMIGY
jgi:hypothetical protein